MIIDQVITDTYTAARRLRGVPAWAPRSEHRVQHIFSAVRLAVHLQQLTRDMGNVRDDAEFFDHFDFLIAELRRVMKPGRNVSFHCMDMPSSKERDGVIGLKDFPRRPAARVPAARVHLPREGDHLERPGNRDDRTKRWDCCTRRARKAT